jgi:hypothetical protein
LDTVIHRLIIEFMRNWLLAMLVHLLSVFQVSIQVFVAAAR